jgi:hypothetical protein
MDLSRNKMKAINRRYISKQAIVAAISMVASFACCFVQAQKPGDGNITAQQVKQAFTTTSQQNHPRLFFNANDIQRVKTLLQQKDSLVLFGYRQLEMDAKQTLHQPLLTYYLDDAKLRVPSIHTFAKQIPALVMMYQLTGDTLYASRVFKQMQLMESYPDWGANRHFLDAGIGAFNFALAYDGLYNYLSAAQRSVLRNAIRKQVFEPGKKQLEKREWWATASHNWNGICNGGIIMAALAMYEDDPDDMSNIVAMAANGLPNYIKAFEPDGQSEEGLMYWSYGLMYTTIAFESMQRTLGTTFKLDDTPGFKKTGWFPLYVSGPVTSLSFGDDPIKNSRSHSFYWFAKRNNDSALARLQHDLIIENKNASWMDMIYYDPGMINKATAVTALPTDTYVRGIEVMALRENWKKGGMFLSMHGGSNHANHGHLDAGTFDLQANGEVWAYSDLGSDNYTYPGYFSKETKPGYLDTPIAPTEAGRWHFYRLRAEGKNVVVINPSTSPDQDEMSEAKMIANASDKNHGFYVIDLADCYKRDVTSFKRGIMMNRKTKVMTVQDDIVAKQPADLWWSMHTKAAIKISGDGKLATLQQNGKTMIAKLLAPANGFFTILPATYLPGQSFPLTKNSENKGFVKLAIHLTNASEACIRIDFSEDKKAFRKAKRITSLTAWK